MSNHSLTNLESTLLALLVEDDNSNRSAKLQLLDINGFSVIGVSSKENAEQELRAGPSVDIIITDVNLDPNNDYDISGVDFARETKGLWPDIPIVAYSGRFETGAPALMNENDLSEIFYSVHLKGREDSSSLLKHIENWRDEALKYREKRSDHALQELQRLKSKYDIDAHDYNLLREFVPGDPDIPLPAESGSTEGSLRKVGYRFKIIEKGEMYLDENGDEKRVISPIPIWIQVTDECTIAEVYQFSDLYAVGESEKEAIEKLLQLMDGFYQDLASDDEGKMLPLVRKMWNFLKHVFG